MTVHTLEDWKGLPKGSGLEVLRENKRTYRVRWSSMGGTYDLTVPKKICKHKPMCGCRPCMEQKYGMCF